MNTRTIVKLSVDVVMTLLLLILMGYQFLGEELHEWMGIGMFILFIAHHILNLNWHKNIFKGKYTAVRIAVLMIDVLLLFAMIIQMYSGIIMSRYPFNFLQISGGMSFIRKLHVLGAYWGYVLMSLHIGLHWNMLMRMIRKKFFHKQLSVTFTVIGIFIAGYGLFSFVQRDFLTYLFLKNEFVFLNYNESKILFYIDYIAIMGLFVFVSYYILKLCRYVNKIKKDNRSNF